MNIYRGKIKQTIMSRLPGDVDLYNALTEFLISKNIAWGTLTLIGAVRKANLAYYNQQEQKYEEIFIDKAMEITSGLGNISLKDNQSFLHIHLTLADQTGKVYGGHLLPGTILYAGEFWINEFEGEAPIRVYDENTDLFLWS